MTAGFASVAGSTLVGYALLGAPLPFLLAATVMNAPGVAVHRRARSCPRDRGVRRASGGSATVRDTESDERDRRDRARRDERRADRRHRRLPADRLHLADRARQRAAQRRRGLVRLRRPDVPEGARLGLRARRVADRGPVGRGGQGGHLHRREDGAQRVRRLLRLRPAGQVAVRPDGRRGHLRPGRLRELRLDRDPDRRDRRSRARAPRRGRAASGSRPCSRARWSTSPTRRSPASSRPSCARPPASRARATTRWRSASGRARRAAWPARRSAPPAA